MSISKTYTIDRYKFSISSHATGYIIDMDIWEPILKNTIKEFNIENVEPLKIRQARTIGLNYKCLDLHWIDDDNKNGFPNIHEFKKILILSSRKKKFSKISS